VLSIAPFDSDEEAVGLANDSAFALAASIWTRNTQRGESLARRITAGTVMINDTISCFGISEAPHGGVKASGIGRSHGRFGLEEMVRAKYLDVDRMPRMKKLWWYGYGEPFVRSMEAFVDLQFAHSLIQRVRGALGAVQVWKVRKL
jgi:delta 1-pyrroline-5-carboxylate dehydrogenase